MTHTHTFAELAVSSRTYEEIVTRLDAVGYAHALHRDREGRVQAIDMHGIGLVREPTRTFEMRWNSDAPAPPYPHPPMPTAEECEKQTQGAWNGFTTLACWYPQMGGYVARAVAIRPIVNPEVDPASSCVDVFIWHDGDFPFEGRAPLRMHHCSAEQFITFGETLTAFLEAGTALDLSHTSAPVDISAFVRTTMQPIELSGLYQDNTPAPLTRESAGELRVSSTDILNMTAASREPIVIIDKDGKITVGPTYTPEGAALEFWKFVEIYAQRWVAKPEVETAHREALLIQALHEAADRFALYGTLHTAKGNDDKARENFDMARRMREATE